MASVVAALGSCFYIMAFSVDFASIYTTMFFIGPFVVAIGSVSLLSDAISLPLPPVSRTRCSPKRLALQFSAAFMLSFLGSSVCLSLFFFSAGLI